MKNQKNEIWKPVVGYEGLYEISNLGRLKSLPRAHYPGQICKLQVTDKGGGYLKTRIYKQGVAKSVLIHRLVAQAFIPNPENLPEVNHKNYNTKDNFVENLEWCTQQYNKSIAHRDGRIHYQEATKHYRAKFTEDDIRYIRLSPKTSTALATQYGVQITTISAIRNRVNWKSVV